MVCVDNQAIATDQRAECTVVDMFIFNNPTRHSSQASCKIVSITDFPVPTNI